MLLRQFSVTGHADIEVAGPIAVNSDDAHVAQRNPAHIAGHRCAVRTVAELVADRTLLFAAGRRTASSANVDPALIAPRSVVILSAIGAVGLAQGKLQAMSRLAFVL
jgi:hypothetical protein